MIKNRQKSIYKCFFIAAISLIILLFVFILVIEDSDFKYAGIFLTFFLSVVFCIITFIFYKRSRTIEKALENNDFIARWKFSQKQWEDFIIKEYNLRKEQKRAMFFFLTIITVIIFLVFIFLINEGKLVMFLVMLGLVSLYAFMAFAVPILIKRFHSKGDAEVMIMKNGILLNKQLHVWNIPTSKFKKAEYSENPFEMIKITYSYYDRTGPRQYTVVSPVPDEKEAKRVIEILNQ